MKVMKSAVRAEYQKRVQFLPQSGTKSATALKTDGQVLVQEKSSVEHVVLQAFVASSTESTILDGIYGV